MMGFHADKPNVGNAFSTSNLPSILAQPHSTYRVSVPLQDCEADWQLRLLPPPSISDQNSKSDMVSTEWVTLSHYCKVKNSKSIKALQVDYRLRTPTWETHKGSIETETAETRVAAMCVHFYQDQNRADLIHGNRGQNRGYLWQEEGQVQNRALGGFRGMGS